MTVPREAGEEEMGELCGRVEAAMERATDRAERALSEETLWRA